jgi:DTW domain-containing protein YfiP
VLILQHPQEQDALLGSAQLLVACVPQVKLVVGLSWRNLGHALGEEGVDARRWAVLFPDREAEAGQVTGRGGPIEPSELEGVIALDGTWSKAKTLWWRNPWLSKLRRLTITLESVAAALTLCGEPPEVEAGLSRVFRTLVQRVRDAQLIPDKR